MRAILTFLLVFPARSYRLQVFPPDQRKTLATRAISDPNRHIGQPK
ncbi:MAG TPA: hypothetical protein VKR06_20650 [Ktedonosporobacter sp.]|nr:hypothetical protein [Ktedonosporobacter sp.]